MTPFKRLSESGGREPWLDAAAQQVQAGDAWALISDAQAQRIGARALATARERTRPRSSRALVIAFAVAASTAALAAAGRFVVAARTPVVVPAAPSRTLPVVVPPAPVEAPVAPVVEQPQPVPAPVEKPAVVVKPARPRPVDAPQPTLAPRAEPPPAPEPSALEVESQLLLKALHQLRVEGNPDAALATLDAHDAQFPAGALAEEAAAARREAQALKAGRSP